MNNEEKRFELRLILTAGMNAGVRKTVFNIQGLEFNDQLSREESLSYFLKDQDFIIATEHKGVKSKGYKKVLISVRNILSAEFIDD
ncbi:hypothetical protein [Apilactobacillus timberlakei]|uniref:Uncharacterized protein n=1 Tax=Apilactobacillus timberlakei TaxID=2008380 RepID=A0ABY2YUD2_9LACO|nr:hypothetical protein [Apilactobacillus timberlakei]TPR13316.1 hypothetical protein DYZ97_05355 [Apilactobacillus timberlakei]TPR14361.1 hypothetical protein DY048_05280 [Apilactobacillus timberlakei]TPR16614.1 hypothetical protein DY052_03370 [Apilactobacillus timberlakei]TPR19674.1 hypothetical protein DY138_03235 [Apilactobacillus timberlakei]TPR20651.1 hypothetical protein DY061_04875 [Apilactobacillus timberlakei]